MPNINLDDAYILGETGAQVDKVTGLFTKDEDTTSGEKAFAQLNIGTAGSNRNLLDNPWWGTNESVNQRGVTSGNGGYFVDRWNFSLPGTASVTWSTDENGFTGTTTTNFIITHKITNVTELGGKTLTASVMLSDGTIHSGTIVRNNATAQEFFRNSNPTWVVLMDSDNSFRIRVFNGTLSIRAVKLELGSVSTLANDVPPNYDEELVKCKRYFRRITNIGRGRLFIGVGFSGGVEVPNIFGVGNEMRKTTSLTVTYSGSFVVNAGTDIAVTGISRNENNSNFGLSFTASGITPYTLYSILGSAGAYIDISADL